MLHSSRAILALNGSLMIILGGAFWNFPEFFTLAMFPDFAESQDVLDVGIALRKIMGGRLCLYWSDFIFMSVQFKINRTKIVIFLVNRFLSDDRNSLRGKSFWARRRSAIHSDFLFNLVYCFILCGITTVPRISVLLPTLRVIQKNFYVLLLASLETV